MELLIVGLDGLSYNMIEEFDVETPFLDSVRSAGVSGDLRSVDTPTTLPAWTSFATGKDPGSHGLPTMLAQSKDYEISPATPNQTDPAIYDLLDDALFINLPASLARKPAAARTTLVSSFLASDREQAVPENLHRLDTFDSYLIHADESLKSDPEAYFEHLIDITNARHAFAEEAFEKEEPRVGFVLFSTPDWVGHHLQFAPDKETRMRWYRSVVEACDEFAGSLASQATNVILLSDHGFEHKPKTVHPQTWMEQEQYLRKDSNETVTARLMTGLARQIARRFDTLFDFLRTVYLRVIQTESGERLGNVVNFNPDVDFSGSRAWHLRYGCIYINDAKFEAPTVDNPEQLRQELRRKLTRLTDDDGNPVFESIHYPTEIYDDPDEEARLPDLIARPAPGVLPLRAFSPNGEPVLDTPGHEHYDHRYNGLFAAEGPLFSSGECGEISIVDVLPTILHALSERVSPDFDGAVREEVLSTDRSVELFDVDELPQPRIDQENTIQQDVASERLRNLGYLE